MLALEDDEARRAVHREIRPHRPADLHAVVRALLDPPAEGSERPALPPLPRLDPTRVGGLGHSFGGWTALKLPALEARVRAVCSLAPVAEPFVGARAFAPGELPLPAQVRTLVVAARDDVLVDLETSLLPLFERLGPGAILEILDDADHFHFCDGIELLHRMHENSPPSRTAQADPSPRPVAGRTRDTDTPRRPGRGLLLARPGTGAPAMSDLQGKTCIVTGATSGIGEASAEALALRGADVAIVCRSAERGEATKARIEKRTGTGLRPTLRRGLRAAGRRAPGRRGARSRAAPVDVLLNNAGVTMLARSETPDGYETTFAVNHLAPFLLTNLLMPKLLARPGARIVNVASHAHRFGWFDLDDLQSRKRYSALRVYGGSKLANVLFTNELASRVGNRDLRIWSVHPGAVATRLGANNGGIAKILLPVLALFFRTPAQGRRPRSISAPIRASTRRTGPTSRT
jgi:retinol dehydrogenase-12